jgi:hypothetical protein
MWEEGEKSRATKLANETMDKDLARIAKILISLKYKELFVRIYLNLAEYRYKIIINLHR